MASINNFVFLGEWWEKLEGIKDKERHNDFIQKIVKYGVTGEIEFTDDPFANAWLQSICESIDRMKNKYEEKIENGKKVGRDQAFDREDLKKKIAEGKKAAVIASELGVSVDAIYHDSVWKNRKVNNLYR